MSRQRLIFNAFTHVTPNHHSHGYWRHPQGRGQLEYKRLQPWIELAKTVERGRFDTVFLADVVGVYDRFRGNGDTSIRTAMQFPSLDPASLVSALAAATEHVGFAVTSSVIQDHPFDFARRMSTLDHLSDGRIAWNIVTSYLDNAARNFGQDKLEEHDERYRWAEEYVEVVYKLWEASWEDDALVADFESGVFAEPSKVRKILHRGARYSVEGPHLAEPSPQRTPLLFQAGGSEAGHAFAARHAEATFIAARTPESAAKHVADLRSRARAFGRAGDELKIIVSLAPVIGATEQEAHARRRELKEWLSLEALQAFYSGSLGVDLSDIDPNRPLSELLLTNHVRGNVRAFIEAAPDRTVTFGDLLKETVSGRFAGTPEQIADEVQRYADAGVDGFNVVPVTTLGWWTEFVDHVVPVLQKRGLMQTEYAPGTLREKIHGRGPNLPDHHPARALRDAVRRGVAQPVH
ncbi:FMN-dependent oxidoreductase (nitrilotriacetate monooxygenase family) [Paraburkholderia unamae]|uniref:LLM class flavin-dependent oxidoreductase n=1 Tax=Paraburkholderia unamae TaxID=219649 RepID=UPI000DC5CE08|nr:LLM class flavin-dependent oxidoreductase [Paraburkholderia unamae]RAR62587.1 FMN-dependent oxidoreductase (nitrilotriacetate monooxygenase family) [Paraburkholderia unamae]